MNAIDILTDMAGRPREAAEALRDSLTPAVLNAHPLGHPNSVAWLLWHAGREIDIQVAHLSGEDEVWTAQGFRERLALGDAGDGLGYGQSVDEARAIRTDDAAALLDYLDAATETLTGYLLGLSDADLDAVVDENWDPPVTRGVRLVSIIDDAAQHVGQAAYAAGMPELG